MREGTYPMVVYPSEYQYLTYRPRRHKSLHNAVATTATKVTQVTTMRSEPLLISLLISGAPSNTLAGIRQGFGG